jgi:hypothetical protein
MSKEIKPEPPDWVLTPIEGEFVFDEVTLWYTNLSGQPDAFTREGDRYFIMVVPDDRHEELLAFGFNVRYNAGDENWLLKVSIPWTKKKPYIPEPLTIEGFSWAHNNKTGVAAYVKYATNYPDTKEPSNG